MGAISGGYSAYGWSDRRFGGMFQMTNPQILMTKQCPKPKVPNGAGLNAKLREDVDWAGRRSGGDGCG